MTQATFETCLDADEKNAWIQIKSVFGNAKKVAKFKAIITSFSDTFNSSWNEESVFARMDPIATFQRTSRKISLTFKVVAWGCVDAEYNLGQIEKLIGFLYPKWAQGEINPTPQAAPLVDIKFSNLITSQGPSDWLSGYIGSLSVNHDLDAGVLFSGPDPENLLMIPKEITIGFDFTVLHEHVLGGKKIDKYPYNARKLSSIGDASGNCPGKNAVVDPDDKRLKGECGDNEDCRPSAWEGGDEIGGDPTNPSRLVVINQEDGASRLRRIDARDHGDIDDILSTLKSPPSNSLATPKSLRQQQAETNALVKEAKVRRRGGMPEPRVLSIEEHARRGDVGRGSKTRPIKAPGGTFTP